jgi:hypothetical protein
MPEAAKGAGAAAPNQRTGILLVNLGTPDAPTPAAVRRYLREFLGDPRVVQLPRIPWWILLNFVILPFRSGRTAKKYAKVWMPEGSPLRVYLERQVQMLRGYLGVHLKTPIPVVGAMRYGKPGVAQGLRSTRSTPRAPRRASRTRSRAPRASSSPRRGFTCCRTSTTTRPTPRRSRRT